MSATSATPPSFPPASGALPNFPVLVDALGLVAHTDILIVSFFVFFAILKLPSLIVRLSHRSEWSSGIILRSIPSKRGHIQNSNVAASFPTNSTITLTETLYPMCSNKDISRSDSNLQCTVQTSRQDLSCTPSWSTFLHLIATFFCRPTGVPGFSIGRFVILAGYAGIILYDALYISNPIVDFTREGYICMAQLPIIFALGTKNNIFGMMLSVGYEKLNWLHQFTGRIASIAGTVHVMGSIYQWSFNGTLQKKLTEPGTIHGFIAFCGLQLLASFSKGFRQKHYNIFLFSHILGFILFPLGIVLHSSTSVPFVVSGVGIYFLDHVIRICKTRVLGAILHPVPELGLTRIEIPGVNTGWCPGQHVRLRVITSGLGFMGWSEAHPFTIASVAGDGMVLMCKKAGSWTNKLYEVAQSGGSPETGVAGRSVKVILEGPYGGVGNTLLDRSSGVLFVTGGSGITFPLAAIQDLVQKNVEGRSRVKFIELVWCVQDVGSLTPMLPMFSSFIRQVTHMKVHISIFYTRASMDTHTIYKDLPPDIVVAPGRPRIPEIVASVVRKTCMASPSPSGVVVGICAPVCLADQVKTAVCNVDHSLHELAGGVENLWVMTAHAIFERIYVMTMAEVVVREEAGMDSCL